MDGSLHTRSVYLAQVMSSNRTFACAQHAAAPVGLRALLKVRTETYVSPFQHTFLFRSGIQTCNLPITSLPFLVSASLLFFSRLLGFVRITLHHTCVMFWESLMLKENGNWNLKNSFKINKSCFSCLYMSLLKFYATHWLFSVCFSIC